EDRGRGAPALGLRAGDVDPRARAEVDAEEAARDPERTRRDRRRYRARRRRTAADDGRAPAPGLRTGADPPLVAEAPAGPAADDRAALCRLGRRAPPPAVAAVTAPAEWPGGRPRRYPDTRADQRRARQPDPR